MTVGHRVERFRNRSMKWVKTHATWARFVVRVGSIVVAYEDPDDAGEEHSHVSNLRGAYIPSGRFESSLGQGLNNTMRARDGLVKRA